jgi:hypothetical protein
MNMDRLKRKSHWAIFAVSVLLCLCSASWAATYYVDATNGNDSNDGLTASTAWKTIGKVNNSSFNPGDQILFKREEIWREQLIVPSSGSDGNPITFGAYGSKGKPILSGAELFAKWTQTSVNEIYQADCNWIPNQAVEDGKRLDYVSWDSDFLTTANSMRAGTWTLDTTNDLLYAWCTDEANPEGHIMEVSQRCVCVDGNTKNYISVENLKVIHANDDGIDTDGGSNWTVSNVTAEYNGRYGIRTNGDDNIITDCVAQKNRWGIGGYQSDDLTISNCTSHDNDQMNGDGFQISQCDNALIENCTAYNNTIGGSSDGFQIAECANLTFRYNHSYDNRTGINLTGGSYGAIYYNLFITNSSGGIILWDIDGGNTTAYNNTVYQNNTNSGIYINSVTAPCTVTIQNNISYNGGTGKALTEESGVDEILLTLDNNCYFTDSGSLVEWEGTSYAIAQFSTYQSASSEDANSIAQNPQFMNVINQNFYLYLASPCIDTAKYIGLTQDLGGNPVPQGFGVDVGAFEYKKLAEPQNLRILTTR